MAGERGQGQGDAVGHDASEAHKRCCGCFRHHCAGLRRPLMLIRSGLAPARLSAAHQIDAVALGVLVSPSHVTARGAKPRCMRAAFSPQRDADVPWCGRRCSIVWKEGGLELERRHSARAPACRGDLAILSRAVVSALAEIEATARGGHRHSTPHLATPCQRPPEERTPWTPGRAKY